MKYLKHNPLFLILLALFFLLHGIAENYGFIYLSEILKIGIVVVAGIIVLYFITKIFTKNKYSAALISFFFSAWILFFGAVFDWVKSVQMLTPIHSYTVFIPLMFASILLFIFFIRQKKGLQEKLFFYLNILLLIYCIVDAASIIRQSFKHHNGQLNQFIAFDTSLVKARPNVYFVLYDEYPGYKSLKDSFGFKNDSLYRFFEKHDFKILPSLANYNMTFYSMSSMLNMKYIDKSYTALANTMHDDQERIREIKNPAVITYFRQLGYHFTNYSIFDILDKPALKGNSFVVSQATLLTDKIFFNRILKDLGWHFISGKYTIPLIKYFYMAEDRNNRFIQQQLTGPTPAGNNSPQFIYAHFNMPHPPVFLDSSGNYLPAEVAFNSATYGDKQKFLSYVKFANRQIEKLASSICKNDPKAIIIMMSDHGYRNYNNEIIPEPLHFNNFCAVRFPDGNYLPVKDTLSNVNFFPYLFNCEFNQQMKYNGDSTIFLKDKATGN